MYTKADMKICLYLCLYIKVKYPWFYITTPFSAQKMKFSIKDFFSKCDQIHRKQPIWSQLMKKSLMENFIFCAVLLLRMWAIEICETYIYPNIFNVYPNIRLWLPFWYLAKIFLKGDFSTLNILSVRNGGRL